MPSTEDKTREDDTSGPETDQSDFELDPKDATSETRPSVSGLRIEMGQLFKQAVEQTRMALCVTDPHEPDNPIVYVNQAFEEITGYSRKETLGRNCRFLQGPDTDPGAVDRIRQALESQEVRVIELLNYRKDGSSFVNSLHVGPIYDDDGNLTHYYGSQWDVTDILDNRARETVQQHVTDELRHRTRNLFGVFRALLRLTANEVADKEDLVQELSARLEAMVHAHEVSIGPGGRSSGRGDLHTLVEAILRPYRTSQTGRIVIDGPVVVVETSHVIPLGLALHELATNALKYGALSRANGSVHVAWSVEDAELLLWWEERGGPSLPDVPVTASGGGTGSRLMPRMLQSVDGEIDIDPRPEGMRARLRLPV